MTVTAPRFVVDPGYDPHSPGLVGPLHVRGFCVGEEDLNVERFVWIDFAAPIVSGTTVSVVLDTDHAGVVVAGKLLEFTADGRPWLVCYGSPDLLTIVAVPLEHPSLRVLGIAATVIECFVPRRTPREPLPEDTIWRHLQHVSRPAMREWREHGFPTRQFLWATNPESNVEFLRSALCPVSFTSIY